MMGRKFIKSISIITMLLLTIMLNGCGDTTKNNDKKTEKNEKIVDLIIFMGQSNMAGRGITSEEFPEGAPKIIEGAGYEFRSVSDPTRLYPIEEPFGVNENQGGGIGEPDKTGSLVTAFVNAYYKETKVPVVAVSASIGGTTIEQWRPNGNPNYLLDATDRLDVAKEYLEENEYTIRHIYMAWCQGETDADKGVTKEAYKAGFDKVMTEIKKHGVETCFMIQIGRVNIEGQYHLYDEMRECQQEIADERDDVTMVSTLFEKLLDRGLMKDTHHYYQQGYNEVGTDAGKNAGKYAGK